MGHTIASEAATEIALHEIAFCIDVCQNVDAPGYEAPKRLLVRSTDGGVVTIADVVEKLSRYLIEHKDKIVEAKSPFLQMTHEVTEEGEHVSSMPANEDLLAPPDTKVAFAGFFGSIEIGRYVLPVELWAEGE